MTTLDIPKPREVRKLNLDHAVVYDLETFPNCFSLNVLGLFSDLDGTFKISHYRDDRNYLFQWFQHWHTTQTPMVGFNSVAFDYPVLHYISENPHCTVEDIYYFAMGIISAGNRRGSIVWPDDRFAPQIDLFKIMHFDNPAKATSLKALEINMRSETVMEMPLPFGTPLTPAQIDTYLIPYNKHDVRETKKFALIMLDAIKFRLGLAETLRGDVLNFSDSKIGSKILEQRLGPDLCYDEDRRPRQTPRDSIALFDIIFPYIKFDQPEFNRVLSWMRLQTLSADDLTETIKTKGVFTGPGVCATIDGFEFHFGTGGIHGSVSAQRFAADDAYAICDVDVAGLYPAIAIVNRLYPEHFGEKFVEEYAKLPQERAKFKKGTVENAALKLAANGTYGNSNNKFSVFYDPKFTMSITINGQLLLCMLAEWLLKVPTLQIIQINTDGVTYRVRRELMSYVRRIQRMWEAMTGLVLEHAEYSRMWIRDVNNYIAENTEGKLKQKGAYWFPRKFPDDITNAGPPAWHKDFSAVVTIKAAVEHMVHGADIAQFIHSHDDPFDFMCRQKVDRSSRLMIGDQEVQRTTRYFVSTNGAGMKKISPPTGTPRTFKRKNGISDYKWHTILQSIPPGTHDPRIHTKNKSLYTTREIAIEAGYKVTEVNVASRFDFDYVNFDWYVDKARKLVI